MVRFQSSQLCIIVIAELSWVKLISVIIDNLFLIMFYNKTWARLLISRSPHSCQIQNLDTSDVCIFILRFISLSIFSLKLAINQNLESTSNPKEINNKRSRIRDYITLLYINSSISRTHLSRISDDVGHVPHTIKKDLCMPLCLHKLGKFYLHTSIYFWQAKLSFWNVTNLWYASIFFFQI